MAKTDKTDAPAPLPVMVHRDGREWTPEDRAEATNLRARGWAPKSTAPANKASSTPSK